MLPLPELKMAQATIAPPLASAVNCIGSRSATTFRLLPAIVLIGPSNCWLNMSW
jgi:hypothetical protein